ncbi:MAG: pentapeptide repeat-containing protein [Solirubrobacterales bacterium]
MARSSAGRTFGADNEPEISEDHLTDVGGDCQLEVEFVHEDVRLAGGSFAAADAGSGRVSHALLSDVDLRESRLRGVRLLDVKGTGLEVSNGDWRGSYLRRVLLSGCRLTGLVLSEAKLEDVTFRDCKLDYANLRFAELSRVTFEDCVLTDTDCQGMRCEESRFSGCRMHGTDFSKAELDGTDLRGSDLHLTGGVAALRGAVVNTSQVIDLAIPLAEAAGISVLD